MWIPGIVADVGTQGSQGWRWWGDAGLADCPAGAALGGSDQLHHRVVCTVVPCRWWGRSPAPRR